MSDQPNSNQVPSTAEDQQTNRRSIAPYVVGAIFVCLVVGGVFYAVSSRTKRPDEAEPPETTVAQQADVPASPEERWRLNDYVGSSKCAECHAAIAETFAAHPMANTLATVADASPIEMVEDDASEFEAFGRQYRVERDGDRMIHTEFMTDEDGEAIYEQSEEVHFAVGSGMNARTYMMNHDGVMFESPITWYTEKAIWDLSPGYHENPAQRFTRRITDGCLQCHSGLPLPTGDGTSARFAKEPFFELGIGCERCHGPGRQHVEKFESGGGQLTGVNQDDMLIVNPERLDGRARDDVCYQCHMGGRRRILRPGKSYHDFQPGMMTEEIWTVFVSPKPLDGDGPADFISHVEQMESSACFRGSGGEMRCTTCHDPHQSPTFEEKPSFYRERCNLCHADQGCSLPMEEREPAPILNSCIHCHVPSSGSSDIPHTSASDHRILRNPERSKGLENQRASHDVWTIFGGSEQRMPEIEVVRAQALALAEQAMEEGNPVLLSRTIAALESVKFQSRNDVDVLSNLGFFYCTTGNDTNAMRMLQSALQLDPYHELTLKNLGMMALKTGSLGTAQRSLESFLEINRWDGTIYGPYTSVLANSGQMQNAIEAVEQGLLLDPTHQKLRMFAVQLYARIGDQEKSLEHREILEKIAKRIGAPSQESGGSRRTN
ncbi:MAG: hypothetical protein KDA93_25430 [Planctomycetaceae bacterium]|nr:hypothetical protein [Planctomycetaceae bacterium]